MRSCRRFDLYFKGLEWGGRGGGGTIASYFPRMLVPFVIRLDGILFIASTDGCVVAAGGLRAEGENKNATGSEGSNYGGLGEFDGAANGSRRRDNTSQYNKKTP